MALNDENEKNSIEERSAGDIIAGFIGNNRKALFALVVLAAACTGGFIVFSVVKDVLEKKAIAQIGEFSRRIDEAGGLSAPASETDALLEEIASFAPKTFGYAAARAYSIEAGLYAARKDWARAEEAWLLSAKKASGIFLAPLSLYNAAAAAEEQGNLDRAVEHHERCVDYPGINSAAARSQFSIGRIRESQNNREAAIEAYRRVIEKWGEDTNWSNFARSRIIALGG